jgi:hypothetical protein
VGTGEALTEGPTPQLRGGGNDRHAQSQASQHLSLMLTPRDTHRIVGDSAPENNLSGLHIRPTGFAKVDAERQAVFVAVQAGHREALNAYGRPYPALSTLQNSGTSQTQHTYYVPLSNCRVLPRNSNSSRDNPVTTSYVDGTTQAPWIVARPSGLNE